MMYESEVLTIYKAENGFVVKCKQPPSESKPAKNEVYKPSPPDEMNVYQSIAQVLKKVKEELAPGDMDEDKKKDDLDYKASFKEAAKKK